MKRALCALAITLTLAACGKSTSAVDALTPDQAQMQIEAIMERGQLQPGAYGIMQYTHRADTGASRARWLGHLSFDSMDECCAYIPAIVQYDTSRYNMGGQDNAVVTSNTQYAVRGASKREPAQAFTHACAQMSLTGAPVQDSNFVKPEAPIWP